MDNLKGKKLSLNYDSLSFEAKKDLIEQTYLLRRQELAQSEILGDFISEWKYLFSMKNMVMNKIHVTCFSNKNVNYKLQLYHTYRHQSTNIHHNTYFFDY